ncbi:hypothetical protein ADIS_0400 [Lunatimonas lonarensis]|uniref:Uncharacterized protein n=1 Tax=Lunatimonas lonarensis TaxID=1232681 RepID=R7ZYI7_9BACT|nr:hypothetical protein ADIS_0400 [Lunatimonas lonarensis]
MLIGLLGVGSLSAHPIVIEIKITIPTKTIHVPFKINTSFISKTLKQIPMV